MKYFLSLCILVKEDDRDYLEEFILYYWIHGVEHFYIYDNSSDNIISDFLFKKYFFRKTCTIISYPGLSQQVNSYNACLKEYGKNTEWLYFVEINEYILPKKHSTLREFLKDYDDVHAIGINWVSFGTSFHKKKQYGLIIDKYQHCSDKEDVHIKTICKPKFVDTFRNRYYIEIFEASKYVDANRNNIIGPFNKHNNNSNIIQINSYSKSMEEVLKNNKIYKLKNIDLNTLNNDIKDDLIATKYLPLLERIIDVINTNWEVYKLLNKDLNFKSRDEYYEHLIVSGISENRPIKLSDKYPGFCLELYRNNYMDLQKFDDIELQKHYIYHGIRERRVANKDIR